MICDSVRVNHWVVYMQAHLLLLGDSNRIVESDAQAEVRQLLEDAHGALVDFSRVRDRCRKHLVGVDESLGDRVRPEHFAERRARGMRLNKRFQQMFNDRRGCGAD